MNYPAMLGLRAKSWFCQANQLIRFPLVQRNQKALGISGKSSMYQLLQGRKTKKINAEYPPVAVIYRFTMILYVRKLQYALCIKCL